MSANRMGALAAPLNLPLKAALIIGGSLLLWLSAKVQVPFWPVPMTLQVMALFAIAATVASPRRRPKGRWACRCSPARRKRASGWPT